MANDLENLIGHFQVQNQQLQTLMMQKQSLTIQGKEIEKALEYVESSKGDIYRTVGPLLVKSSAEDIKKQLEEEKEDIDIKLQSLEMQEKKMKEKIKESQEKIQSMMPSGQGG